MDTDTIKLVLLFLIPFCLGWMCCYVITKLKEYDKIFGGLSDTVTKEAEK